MPQTNRTAQRKRRSKVVLALGAAGLSLSLASSASAAIGGMNGASSTPVSKQLYEEEISDVSLATFHVFDRENAGTHGRRARLAKGALMPSSRSIRSSPGKEATTSAEWIELHSGLVYSEIEGADGGFEPSRITAA